MMQLSPGKESTEESPTTPNQERNGESLSKKGWLMLLFIMYFYMCSFNYKNREHILLPAAGVQLPNGS
jgi:hypothetical protein